MLAVFLTLLMAAPAAMSTARPSSQSSSAEQAKATTKQAQATAGDNQPQLARVSDAQIVILFRDGRQQTFSLADIERIEFKTPASNTALFRGNSFVGKWKVGEGNGGTFFITLNRDGSASKSMGASHGTWTIVDNEARISWDDGWHDAIRKVGNKYEKRAFEPGKSFTDTPGNVTDAKKTETQPI